MTPTDLVERLREHAARISGELERWRYADSQRSRLQQTARALGEAADEIERLRGERAEALSAAHYGMIDGAHHKDWVIDQMVRCLCSCRNEWASAIDCNGLPYDYLRLGTTDAYEHFRAEVGDSWDEGVAP